MILTVDVHYRSDNTATVAGILFPKWESDEVERILVKQIDKVAAYEPGSFYKRELPCITSLLNDIDDELEAIIIDGYVTLGREQKPGLGMHLYKSRGEEVPVIGVAKNKFLGTPQEYQVFRGKSKTPLYITAIGVSLTYAKEHIVNMHGKNRIPTLLKKVDHVCRDR